LIFLPCHISLFWFNDVRRPEVEQTLATINELGGDINVVSDYLDTGAFNEILKDMPPVKLALNCVGGEIATNTARALGPNGTFVTYGGMSKQALSIPYDLLVYKQLQMKGFWISQWYDTHTKEEASVMINNIASAVRDKQLHFFYRLHDLDDFDFALQQATTPFQHRKVVLTLNYPDRMKLHDERDPEDYFIFDRSLPV
jgi:mitochondrial enoyl-[acyl-carrier protein] reductase / trans-2-enoyl-CoA reductase